MIELRRSPVHPTKDASAPSPSWFPVDYERARGDRALALVKCDRGHVSVMSDAVHRVAPDGQVSPSYVCPYDCSWHVFIRLASAEAVTQ